jgi:hypothetical protein
MNNDCSLSHEDIFYATLASQLFGELVSNSRSFFTDYFLVFCCDVRDEIGL